MPSSALTITSPSTGPKIVIAQLRELDCQGCADNIRATIGNCDGVLSVRASVYTKQVTVEFEYPFTEEILVQQLERAHFELAEPEAPQLELHEPAPHAISA